MVGKILCWSSKQLDVLQSWPVSGEDPRQSYQVLYDLQLKHHIVQLLKTLIL